MSHKGLKYVKQEQPSFIRKFREKAGLKPEATIEDKLKAMTDDCNDEEKEDEKPMVVVLNEGDLTAEEAKVHDDKEEQDDGKIVFRKPTKRSKDSALSASSKKSKIDDDCNKNEKSDEKAKKLKTSKKLKKPASSLLSFNDDDEG